MMTAISISLIIGVIIFMATYIECKILNISDGFTNTYPIMAGTIISVLVFITLMGD